MLGGRPGKENSPKALYCRAAGGRDFAAIDHQAVRDAHAVGDELSTIGLGIHHAGALILLRVGQDPDRPEQQAKQRKRYYQTRLHDHFFPRTP